MRIEVKDLAFTYSPGTPFAKRALDGIDLSIEEGDFVGILGHTGSGKSTFILHLNGLIKLQSGSIDVFDIKLVPDKKKKQDLRKLRGTVGMVFQYPEYQLFEETIAKDIAFGPTNMGLSQNEIDERVREAMAFVGLAPELADQSPFALSGGQKRRVAIAGVIAMRPEVLILDEPTAGLDPAGRDEIFAEIQEYHKQTGATILFVTHSMEDAARMADRMLVMKDAKVMLLGTPREVFSHAEEIIAAGLDIPEITKVILELNRRGLSLDPSIFTVEDAVRALAACKKEGKTC